MSYPRGKIVYENSSYWIEEVWSHGEGKHAPFFVIYMMVTAKYFIPLSGSDEMIYSILENAIKRVNELAEGK